jgi:hypothetical protein
MTDAQETVAAQEITTAYRAALAPEPAEATAAFARLLSDDVRLVGPFGVATGREAVADTLGAPMLPALLAAASWEEPSVEGPLIGLRATITPATLIGGVLTTLTLDESGAVSEITQEMVPAPRPEPTALHITPAIQGAVDGALDAQLPMTLAYVDPQGVPHLSSRGSVHVHTERALAIWVRDAEGGFPRAIADHPSVALWYRDPANRTNYQFSGRAHLVTDAVEAKGIYDSSAERERNVDPRRRGVAVIVELEQIEGSGPDGRVFMRA